MYIPENSCSYLLLNNVVFDVGMAAIKEKQK